MNAIEILPLPDEGQIQVLWQLEYGRLHYEMYRSAGDFFAAVPDGQSHVDAMGW